MSGVATLKDIDEVIGIVRDFMQQVGDKFDQVGGRFDIMDNRLARLENDINEIKQEIVDSRRSHDRLLNTVDSFFARIDKYEVELAARDSQFEKLLVWA